MNVLMVSLDTTFLSKEGTARGDTLSRHVELSERLSHLHVVVFSVGRARGAVLHPTPKLTLYPTQSQNKAMRVFDAFRIAARLCRRHPIDVVTTQDPFFTGMVGWAASRLYRIPLNVQVHADCIENSYWIRERLLNRMLNLIGKSLLRKADNVRVVSASEKEKMVRRGIPSACLWNIPEGIANLEKFSSADGSRIRKEYSRPSCGRVVLFVGRLTKQKRLQDLLNAAKIVLSQMPGVVFVVAGDGPELPSAKALSSRLSLDKNAIFPGNIPYNEMPAYFAAADVLALPSAYEGTARVLMESVAAGLPIVTTRVSGVSDLVVDGENGHIVSVGRPREMADRLLRVLKDPDRYRTGAVRRTTALGPYDRKRNLPLLLEMWSQIARKIRN